MKYPRPDNLNPSLFEMRQAYDREQQRLGQREAHCERCDAKVIWIQMGPRRDGKPGGRMICDPGWKYGDGRKSLVTLVDAGGGKLLGKMIVKAGPTVRGFEPHWGSCPNARDFKKPAERPPNILPFRPSR